MNKIISLLFLLVVSVRSEATIWQVNNEPGAPADFAALQPAIDAAAAGDTIYLYPGTASYGGITLTKPLSILGPGHAVEYTPMVPSVDVITFYNGSSGFILKGIRLWYISVGAYVTCNDVLVSGCMLSAQGPFQLPGNATLNNWIIEGCVIYNQSNGMAFNGPNVQNWTLRNNIITHWNASGSWIGYATNMTIEHNIFIQTNSASATGIFGPQNTNVLFRDNIVYYTASIPPGNLLGDCTNCTMSNNLTYSPNATLPALAGTGNIDNANPEFVGVPLGDPYYSYAKDYHLASTSPALGTGTGGADIGVYSGIHPFRPKGWSNTLPRIGNLTPLQNFAPPGGSLLSNLKAYSAGN